MPARRVKSLREPVSGYNHREHRSTKSKRGLNTKRLREQRIMKKIKHEKELRRIDTIIAKLIAVM